MLLPSSGLAVVVARRELGGWWQHSALPGGTSAVPCTACSPPFHSGFPYVRSAFPQILQGQWCCRRNRARHIWSSAAGNGGFMPRGSDLFNIPYFHGLAISPFSFSRLQTRKQWNKWPKYTVSYVGEGKFILNLWEIEVCYLVPPIKIIKRTESDIKSIHFHDKAHYEQRKYSPILTCSHYCSKIYHVKCNVQGRKGKHSLPLP